MNKILILLLVLSGINIQLMPAVLAKPEIDIEADRGAYLIKSRKDLMLAADVLVHMDPGMDELEYKVIMTTPSGQKFDLPVIYHVDGYENTFMFSILPFSVMQSYADYGFLGEYRFDFMDMENNVLASATDFIIPSFDVTQEKISYFDDTKITPQDQTIITENKIIFHWVPIPNVKRYFVSVYKTLAHVPDLRRRVALLKTEGDTVELATTGLRKGKYFWRLEAVYENRPEVDNVVLYTLENDQPPSFYLK